jgi:hypothetical protein
MEENAMKKEITMPQDVMNTQNPIDNTKEEKTMKKTIIDDTFITVNGNHNTIIAADKATKKAKKSKKTGIKKILAALPKDKSGLRIYMEELDKHFYVFIGDKENNAIYTLGYDCPRSYETKGNKTYWKTEWSEAAIRAYIHLHENRASAFMKANKWQKKLGIPYVNARNFQPDVKTTSSFNDEDHLRLIRLEEMMKKLMKTMNVD